MSKTSSSLQHTVVHIATVSPNYRGTGFPPLVEHVPVSVVILKLIDDTTIITQKTISSLKEEEVLVNFLFSELKLPTTLVTFRGRSFTFPVMVYRALRYGVDASSYLGEVDDAPLSPTAHLDVSDWLSSYGVVPSSSLSSYIQMVGLPQRPAANQVSSQFSSGDFQGIEGNLATDVMLIASLLLRISLSRGMLSREDYSLKARSVMKAFFNHNPSTRGYLDDARAVLKEFFLIPTK